MTQVDQRFCLSRKLSTQQFSTWMFVSSFLAFVVSLFWWTFEAAGGVLSVMSQPQKQGCHKLQRVDLARPFLVSPAIKIEIENSLGMALSKAKSGSAWQSHFWQCGTLQAARDKKLFAWRKWIKGFVWAESFQRNWGGPLLGVQKANVFTAPKMRLLQWPFLPKLARL